MGTGLASRYLSTRLAVLLGVVLTIVTSCAAPMRTTGVRSTPNAPVRTAPPAVATAAVPTAIGPGGPWKLAWNDEFSQPAGTPPDPHKWAPVIGVAGGNGQLDYDTAQNAYQDGQGNLVIEGRRENPAHYQCLYGSCAYTSAQLTTRSHFSFTYGRIEARIKIPAGQGIWPAFWLLGDGCKGLTCGEMDVMEIIGKEPSTLYGTLHGPSYFSGIYQLPRGIFADAYHVFALQWDPRHIAFFVDGINYATFNRSSLADPNAWIYSHPFYVILDLAIGGTWPGNPDVTTTFPSKMYVSYVRFYTNT